MMHKNVMIAFAIVFILFAAGLFTNAFVPYESRRVTLFTDHDKDRDTKASIGVVCAAIGIIMLYNIKSKVSAKTEISTSSRYSP